MSAKKPTANLRDAAQQALEALRKHDVYNRNGIPQTWFDFVGKPAISALRAALADTQDWDEIKALRASLREHMAEIHRLRAAGRQALAALEQCGLNDERRSYEQERGAINGLRAALAEEQDENTVQSAGGIHSGISDRADCDVETVTDRHDKEGDKLSLSSERKYLSEESLNEVVAQLKEATADREARIIFTPTHMVFTGDTLDCLKKLADERNADTGKTSDDSETNFGNMAQAVDPTEDDHIADANKMVASCQESRQVEPVAWCVAYDDPLMGRIYSNPTMYQPEAKALVAQADSPLSLVSLYPSSFRREPLTDEEIIKMWQAIDHGKIGHTIDFARAIERAIWEKNGG